MEVPREKLRLKDNPKVLSPPILTQPIYGCSNVVNVTGYVPQAKLDVEVDGAIVVNGFPGGSPNPFGALIPLPSTLTPGDTVYRSRLIAAIQDLSGVVAVDLTAPAANVDTTVNALLLELATPGTVVLGV